MSLPTIVKTWKQLLTTGVPGKRLAYTSLIDQTQQAIYEIKNFLCNGSGATTKYTVLWSASGGTGPTNSSDHTDRITSAATWTPRATVAAASQAWVVLTGGNGEQILIAFQGATDDICRISVSAGGLFVLAGTTNNQPTATDEYVFNNNTLVGSSTSTDRILHIWAEDNAKMFRVVILRAAVMVGGAWGAELISPGVTSPNTVTGNMWAFCYTSLVEGTGGLHSNYIATSKGGAARTVVGGTGFTATCRMGMEATNVGGTIATQSSIYTFQPELQAGFAPYPLSIHSATAGTRGRVGNLIDWWCVNPSGVADGDGFGNSYQFIQLGCALWPNPSNNAPTLT